MNQLKFDRHCVRDLDMSIYNQFFRSNWKIMLHNQTHFSENVLIPANIPHNCVYICILKAEYVKRIAFHETNNYINTLLDILRQTQKMSAIDKIQRIKIFTG